LRAQLPEQNHKLQSILSIVFDESIGQTQVYPPGDAKYFRSGFRFPLAYGQRSAASLLPFGQVKYCYLMSIFDKLADCAPAGNFDIVRVGSYRKDIDFGTI